MACTLKLVYCGVYKTFLAGKNHKSIRILWKTAHSLASTSLTGTQEITFENQKKIIELEMQALRDAGKRFVPNKVPDKHWNDLINTTDEFKRIRFYKFLKKIEMKKIKREMKREEKITNDELTKNEPQITLELKRKNSFFINIRKSAMNNFYNFNILNSIMFGQKIALDFGYHEDMSQSEIKTCINQIRYLYNFNKVDKDPFDIYFCNVLPNTEFEKKLHNALPLKNLVTISEKSYLDFFPREKLVYLTSDCDNELETFNYDDVYVIGGLATRNRIAPLTLAKSEKECLRTAKFPLDKYLHWGEGRKTLTVDQSFKILLTLKNTSSWYKAFEYVPRRKVREFRN